VISDFVPVTVIMSPFRTAGPSCPPRAGVRSTTLPFWRYRLRTSPPGPGLKARTREDSVTMGSREFVPAGTAGILRSPSAGGVGGAGGGLCANAAELNASPRAASRREDGMCIGNTSALVGQAACHSSKPPKFFNRSTIVGSLAHSRDRRRSATTLWRNERFGDASRSRP
jgi:hypothetical protein